MSRNDLTNIISSRIEEIKVSQEIAKQKEEDKDHGKNNESKQEPVDFLVMVPIESVKSLEAKLEKVSISIRKKWLDDKKLDTTIVTTLSTMCDKKYTLYFCHPERSEDYPERSEAYQ